MNFSIRPLRNYSCAILLASFSVLALIAVSSIVDLTTIAVAMLMVVMVCAVYWRSGPALVASAIEVLSFQYYFVPPSDSFAITKPEDWTPLITFAVTAVLVGQLSARAQTRAEQAEARRVEIEALYQQLKEAKDEAAEAELLRRSERLKAALLDAVTHDLRTPLTSIKAAVTTILSELPKDDEYLRELLQVIDEESDRLNRFIQEMMDLARLEGGKMVWTQSETSVHEITENALDRAAPLLAHHRVEVTLDEQLPHLTVDASAMSQVLYSLLDNAAKYSPPSSLIVIAAENGGTSLLFRVSDQGSGIAQEDRERVFEKFTRIGNHGSRPGFGLGLSIAKGIVESHGGRIWIEDGQSRTGTAVVISMPVHPPEGLVQSA